jgi:putative DNA primase/helicase
MKRCRMIEPETQLCTDCGNHAMGQVQPGGEVIQQCRVHYAESRGIKSEAPKTNGHVEECDLCISCHKQPRRSAKSDYCAKCWPKIIPQAKIRDAQKRGGIKPGVDDPVTEETKKEATKVEDGKIELVRGVVDVDGIQFLTQIVGMKAASIEAQPQRWIWPDKIPAGSITWGVGKPGNAKSLWATDIVARISSGRDFPDAKNPFNGVGKKVLMYAGEDDVSRTVVPRLIAAEADLENVILLDNKSFRVFTSQYKRIEKRELDLSADCAVLTQLLKNEPEIVLFVADPITGIWGNVNTNSDSDMRPILAEVRDMCEARGLTFVGVAHTNKRSDAAAIHQIQGASSFAAIARCAWLFTHDPDSDDEHAHMMSNIKGNLTDKHDGLKLFTKAVEVEGAGAHPMIIWGDGTPMKADDVIAAAREKSDSRDAKRETAKSTILALLADKPMRSPEVYEAVRRAGIADKTGERAADDLTRDGKIIRRQKPHAKGWWMALPEHADQFELKPEGRILEQEEL